VHVLVDISTGPKVFLEIFLIIKFSKISGPSSASYMYQCLLVYTTQPCIFITFHEGITVVRCHCDLHNTQAWLVQW